MAEVAGAYLAYQVHPDHAGLVDEVIDWYDATAADIDRTVIPSAADEFALGQKAAHGSPRAARTLRKRATGRPNNDCAPCPGRIR